MAPVNLRVPALFIQNEAVLAFIFNLRVNADSGKWEMKRCSNLLHGRPRPDMDVRRPEETAQSSSWYTRSLGQPLVHLCICDQALPQHLGGCQACPLPCTPGSYVQWMVQYLHLVLPTHLNFNLFQTELPTMPPKPIPSAGFPFQEMPNFHF